MLVEAVLYQGGTRVMAGRLDEVASHALARDGFVWAGFHDPTPDEINEMEAIFGLHPLAVEDAVKASQRPKVERYGDWVFVVVRTARYLDEPEEVELGEIQVFVSDSAIVVIRHGAPVPLGGVRRRLEANPEWIAEGTPWVLHAVIDEVVDGYQAVLSGLDDDVTEVELEVFGEARKSGGQLIERMYFLQREVLAMHRALHPLIGALPDLVVDPIIGSQTKWTAYFRDVSDHLLRQADQLQGLRDLLGAALSANATQVTLQQNEDMRKISAWVAIVAVPTLIAGIYGMNFDHMPELGWRLGYPLVLAFMLTVSVSLFRQFRRTGWL